MPKCFDCKKDVKFLSEHKCLNNKRYSHLDEIKSNYDAELGATIVSFDINDSTNNTDSYSNSDFSGFDGGDFGGGGSSDSW